MKKTNLVKSHGSLFDLKKQFQSGQLWSLLNSDNDEFERVTDEQHLAVSFASFSLYRDTAYCDEPELTYLEIAIEGLLAISEPICHMSECAEREGYSLNAMNAVALSNDPEYLRELARSVLIKLGQ